MREEENATGSSTEMNIRVKDGGRGNEGSRVSLK